MGLWLTQWLPEQMVLALAPVALIVVGFIVERHYVARVTLFANAVGLATYFATRETLPLWLTIYINAATVAGILALFSPVFQFPLATLFYRGAMIFGSVVSGAILLMGILGSV